MFIFKRNFMGREQNFVMDNQYVKLSYFFTLKLLFESDLYNTFQDIYVIYIEFFVNFGDNL